MMRIDPSYFIKNKVNLLLGKYGYELKRKQKNKDLLTNVFNTNYVKRVLISYLTAPFTSGIKLSHTNLTECYTAAEIFKNLGYNVDIVNFDDNSNIDFYPYNIIFGQHIPFEKSFYHPSTENLKKIFYCTGNSHFYYFPAASKVVNDFYKKTGKFIPESGRIDHLMTPLQFLCSDFVISLGNEFSKKTFNNVSPRIKCENLNAFYFDVYDIDLHKKNYSKAKKNFLWFGSGGLISKGLGICIEYFSNRDDCTLHICGGAKNETKFWEIFNPVVEKSSNIINHGFINVESDIFRQIMDTCAFAIFPSVSEGGCPALLNVMANGGLIPIATEACSVDLKNIGIIISPGDKDEIEKSVDTLINLSDEELKKMSIHSKNTIRKNYTFDIYKQNLERIIKHAINQN